MRMRNNTRLKLLAASLLAFLVSTCGRVFAQSNAIAPVPISYATVQVISNGDSAAVIADKAAHVLPRPNQTEWMRLERTFFLYFGVTIFNGVEWGNGRCRPSGFQ